MVLWLSQLLSPFMQLLFLPVELQVVFRSDGIDGIGEVSQF